MELDLYSMMLCYCMPARLFCDGFADRYIQLILFVFVLCYCLPYICV